MSHLAPNILHRVHKFSWSLWVQGSPPLWILCCGALDRTCFSLLPSPDCLSRDSLIPTMNSRISHWLLLFSFYTFSFPSLLLQILPQLSHPSIFFNSLLKLVSKKVNFKTQWRPLSKYFQKWRVSNKCAKWKTITVLALTGVYADTLKQFHLCVRKSSKIILRENLISVSGILWPISW